MQVKHTVLVFVFSSAQELLMIWKKKGQGQGKWNVPGGKCEAGESEAEAAIRETTEETGIIPDSVNHVGFLEFYFPEGGSWSNTCRVFTATQFHGELIPETEECKAKWVPLEQIPWNEMWDSDRIWVPLLLEGKPFHRKYYFDVQDHLVREETVF